MAAPRPEIRGFGRGISNIKSKLLRPALTSHFVCHFTLPKGGSSFFDDRDVDISLTKISDRLSLACSDASLPGSSLATIDIDNDYHGVSEKHAYRRLYDDRADFTFYVSSEDYYVIRFFEAWIGYTVNEQYGDRNKINSSNYNYRVNYPSTYYSSALSITKFERDLNEPGSTQLQYNFVNAYPISITSMPVSYDTSSLLKCTVSYSYQRYWIEEFLTGLVKNSETNPNSPGNPEFNTTNGFLLNRNLGVDLFSASFA
jgi:hypothetical protein